MPSLRSLNRARRPCERRIQIIERTGIRRSSDLFNDDCIGQDPRKVRPSCREVIFAWRDVVGPVAEDVLEERNVGSIVVEDLLDSSVCVCRESLTRVILLGQGCSRVLAEEGAQRWGHVR